MIRNVVFDIGGVLLRLRYQPFIEYLGGAGIDMTNLPRWLEQVDLAAHERGEITGEELLGRIAAMAREPLDPRELQEHWLDMFEKAQEMFALAAGLRQARVAGRNLAESAAEYVTEESRDVVPRAELEAFHDDVDALRDDVERIAAKIARLQRGMPGNGNGNGAGA